MDNQLVDSIECYVGLIAMIKKFEQIFVYSFVYWMFITYGCFHACNRK